jgi:hypothetical protein
VAVAEIALPPGGVSGDTVVTNVYVFPPPLFDSACAEGPPICDKSAVTAATLFVPGVTATEMVVVAPAATLAGLNVTPPIDTGVTTATVVEFDAVFDDESVAVTAMVCAPAAGGVTETLDADHVPAFSASG